MVKKPFTTRLDEEVIDIAQAIAIRERRSVTSVIEVAVMDYAAKVEALHGPLQVKAGTDTTVRKSWRLVIYGSDGSRLPDREFTNVDDLLEDAKILTSTRVPSKLSVSIPNGASQEEREKVRLISKMHG